MASTYTSNSGIQKPGSGEQAGAWGSTVNTNFDIIDRSLSGVGTITLAGTTHTLTTTDGTLSDGHYRVLVLSGSPTGTNTITISPNDQAKIYFVSNSSGQDAVFTQGSGGNTTIANGKTAIIYADGAGASAQVSDFTSVLAAPTDLLNDTTPQLGGDLDANSNDILMGNQSVKFGTSKWEIVLDTGDDDLLFKYNGTTVFKLSSAGAVVSADNVTAYGTP
mgnify:CR=1 FL=1